LQRWSGCRSHFAFNERGYGDEQYPPHLLLALLIYCYANGVFSSRRIERATYRDLAVRYLCADTHPDHDTICAFRRHNLEAIAAAFVTVLELAREMKLLKLGAISVDGTHLKASASKDKNVTYQRAQELRAQLQFDIDALLQKAEQTDRQDEDPQKLRGGKNCCARWTKRARNWKSAPKRAPPPSRPSMNAKWPSATRAKAKTKAPSPNHRVARPSPTNKLT
jgi:transposase